MINKKITQENQVVFLTESDLENRIQTAIELAVKNLPIVYTQTQKEILKVSEVATLLGLHRSTIHRYIRNNQIPYVKRNGSVWLLRSQLLSWLKYNDKLVVDVVLEVLKTNKTCVLVFPEKHE